MTCIEYLQGIQGQWDYTHHYSTIKKSFIALQKLFGGQGPHLMVLVVTLRCKASSLNPVLSLQPLCKLCTYLRHQTGVSHISVYCLLLLNSQSWNPPLQSGFHTDIIHMALKPSLHDLITQLFFLLDILALYEGTASAVYLLTYCRMPGWLEVWRNLFCNCKIDVLLIFLYIILTLRH